MRRLTRQTAVSVGFIALVIGVIVGAVGPVPAAGSQGENGYEVWVADQSNSQGFAVGADAGTHGGFLRIYDGADLDRDTPVNAPRVLDVADIWPNALSGTGAHVVRLHGAVPSPNHHYMNANFVVSGHLGIIDARTRTPVALFRATGTTSGRQNHMSFWSPDGKYLLVANQGGKLLERVNLTWDQSGQTLVSAQFDAAATLDLVGGSGRVTAQPVADPSLPTGSVIGVVTDGQPTTTPNGALKQEPNLRPNNTVICPVLSSDNRHAFVTLGGGGLFVVDYTVEPMTIVAEYDKSAIRPAGCGGVEAADSIYLNAGTPGQHISEFTVYRLPLTFPNSPSFNPPNTPAPVTVYADPDNGLLLPGTNRDAHGVGVTRQRQNQSQFLHQFDRVRNVVESFDLRTLERTTYSLTTANGSVDGPPGQACGTTAGAQGSNDPTPDLWDLSPDGTRFYTALRGPFPLTVSHAAEGSCPGLGIVQLRAGGKNGALVHVVPTTNMNYAGTKNLSDPHAAVVRRKAGR